VPHLPLAGKAAGLVRAKGMQNEVLISSLDADLLALARKRASDLKFGLIYQIAIGSVEQLDADFLVPAAPLVTSAWQLNARGLKISKAHRHPRAWAARLGWWPARGARSARSARRGQAAPPIRAARGSGHPACRRSGR
jgi:hypothetical protein